MTGVSLDNASDNASVEMTGVSPGTTSDNASVEMTGASSFVERINTLSCDSSGEVPVKMFVERNGEI